MGVFESKLLLSTRNFGLTIVTVPSESLVAVLASAPLFGNMMNLNQQFS